MRPGTFERPRTLMVSMVVASTTAMAMNKAELVKEMSSPPILIGISRWISNCSSGLEAPWAGTPCSAVAVMASSDLRAAMRMGAQAAAPHSRFSEPSRSATVSLHLLGRTEHVHDSCCGAKEEKEKEHEGTGVPPAVQQPPDSSPYDQPCSQLDPDPEREASGAGWRRRTGLHRLPIMLGRDFEPP